MEFTDRVRLCEDGVYRWYYDVDMRKDRYMLNITMKVLAIIGAFLMILLVFMPSGGMSKWKVAGITLACFGVVIVLTLVIYLFLLERGGGYYRYRYEMGPEGVRLLQEEGDIERNKALGIAAAVAGTAAGHPVEGAISSITMSASEYAGYTSYRSVKKAVIERDRNCITLKLMVGENCIYVCGDDFDFVKEYILGRLKGRAAAKEVKH